MSQSLQSARRSGALGESYLKVRNETLALARGLSDADATVQSMEDASPAKWHLAHTTWFFETFLLETQLAGYQSFDPSFCYLFNSYYEQVGARHPRPRRGMLTRPSLEEVWTYREHVDGAMLRLLETEPAEDILNLVELGLNHEQQHQELLLTDILHLFAQNPLRPAFHSPEPLAVDEEGPAALSWKSFDAAMAEIGHEGEGFAFDCEGPRHDAIIRPFKLASRPVLNCEWLEFMADGGYRTPTLWLSDGWAIANERGWNAPFYWEDRAGEWQVMTLRGMQPVDPAAPVCHVSYFEADAFARWTDRRLPTEVEWEHAASLHKLQGNFADSGRLRPKPPVAGQGDDELLSLFGDVWEWTQSPYTAYPRFKASAGAVGEYNGKFMNGQYVLRGGSCVTPGGHVRATYRNFFQPDKRWQFSGLRLADDL
ncbi:ergothioneine biosynthesis protein EgtB [Denitrobaculum tricleocarpae]|uniref:ergothioneine biosynthesis protein EgtB n=1 Tax=Denitrobaculum tricleocarpae TaxID=2591009 RepID=UPI001FE7D2F7|nr:ergothioneine biosynthesis protein EgtB [Denitrobaculum tricleocarpae]